VRQGCAKPSSTHPEIAPDGSTPAPKADSGPLAKSFIFCGFCFKQLARPYCVLLKCVELLESYVYDFIYTYEVLELVDCPCSASTTLSVRHRYNAEMRPERQLSGPESSRNSASGSKRPRFLRECDKSQDGSPFQKRRCHSKDWLSRSIFPTPTIRLRHHVAVVRSGGVSRQVEHVSASC
jgi:hypothetical protein